MEIEPWHYGQVEIIHWHGGEGYDRILDSRGGDRGSRSMGLAPFAGSGQARQEQGRQHEGIPFRERQERHRSRHEAGISIMLLMPQAGCAAELLFGRGRPRGRLMPGMQAERGAKAAGPAVGRERGFGRQSGAFTGFCRWSCRRYSVFSELNMASRADSPISAWAEIGILA